MDDVCRLDMVPEVVGGVVVGVVGKGAWIVWAVDVVLVVGLRSLGVGGFGCVCVCVCWGS